ncbi:hypothetical protein CLU79DRAFT_735437 [Phycomyces nitens]|nr:hypothetical protein CLU79DRAFT_735437 [Phycomyces nitens]
MPRDSHLKKILGSNAYNTVSHSKVLLIGAGGIGCEVLKNLVLMGFKDISVVDLDTIEISNLNRQFLFQKEHVGQPKAHVAKEAVLKFQPNANITSHHANIKDPQFGIEWFKQFSLVLNALDNLDARYYVNKMCLAAEVALVESGTSGYKGQSYIIKKGVTECFSCSPKPTPTTYPVCTIRSTPNAPIHCIVWAKNFLFCQLFGDAELSDAIKEDSSDDNAKELSELKREANDLKEIKSAMGTKEYTKKVFTKVFTTDVQRLLDADISRGGRKPPCPLDYDTLEEQDRDPNQAAEKEGSQGVLADRKIWSLPECFHVFKDSANKLASQLLAQQETNPSAMLSFDKDDQVAMDFVTSTSNLRAHIFGIEQKCLFDVKSMAGNIIPAIATTNAIIGGEVVMNAYRILNNEIESSKRNYVDTQVANVRAFMNEEISRPNPECDVCKSKNVPIQVDGKVTLEDIINLIILKPTEEGGAGFDEEFLIIDGNKLIYDPDYDDNTKLPLKDLGIKDSSILRVSPDEGQPIDLIVQFVEPSDEKGFIARIAPKDVSDKEELVPGHKRSLKDAEMEENDEPHKKRAVSEDIDIHDELAREFWASRMTDKSQDISMQGSQPTDMSIAETPGGIGDSVCLISDDEDEGEDKGLSNLSASQITLEASVSRETSDEVLGEDSLDQNSVVLISSDEED